MPGLTAHLCANRGRGNRQGLRIQTGHRHGPVDIDNAVRVGDIGAWRVKPNASGQRPRQHQHHCPERRTQQRPQEGRVPQAAHNTSLAAITASGVRHPAAAAGWALGLSPELIGAGLSSYAREPATPPPAA